MLPAQYRISITARNAAKILPLIGKKFTDLEIAGIKSWVEEESLTAIMEGSGVRVIDPSCSNIRGRIPGMVTKAAVAGAKNRADRDDLSKLLKESRSKEFAASSSRTWIEKHFESDFANEYNKAALTRFLDGADKKFQGLASHKWFASLEKLGVALDDSYLANLRKTYQQSL